MISLKTSEQIKAMREAGRITGEALMVAREHVKSGVSTKHIDDVIYDYITKCGAKPSFLGLYGFPGSACISINDEVIHGIPSKDRIIQDGDIVKIDVGAFKNGFHGDAARSFACGEISENAKNLIKRTEESFFEAMKVAKEGYRLGDLGFSIQSYVEKFGYGVVRDYIGHGVGQKLHESPDVPNYGRAGHGLRLQNGMTIAVEPMINEGTERVKTLDNGWTVVTLDGKLSSHYENTIAIVEGEPLLLTYVD